MSMQRVSVFWPLTLIAVGVVALLVSTNTIPLTNIWALLHIFPYLLLALGVGLLLRSRWKTAGLVVSGLAVVGALAAVIFAPLLGLATLPAWGFETGVDGAVAGSGKIATVTREVSGFSRVALRYPAKVVIVQGEAEGVTLVGDDNLIPQLSANVSSEVLSIQTDERDWNKRVHPSRAVEITITVKSLKDVAFPTAGSVRIEGLKTESLSIDLSGAGDITLSDLNTQHLEVDLGGMGNISASGTANDVSVKINGMGSFYGDKLASLEADVKINGAGNANLQVKDRLSAHINGAGSIGYYGTPQVTRNINGAGSVEALGK
jgi:hypothetical protein